MRMAWCPWEWSVALLLSRHTSCCYAVRSRLGESLVAKSKDSSRGGSLCESDLQDLSRWIRSSEEQSNTRSPTSNVKRNAHLLTRLISRVSCRNSTSLSRTGHRITGSTRRQFANCRWFPPRRTHCFNAPNPLYSNESFIIRRFFSVTSVWTSSVDVWCFREVYSCSGKWWNVLCSTDEQRWSFNITRNGMFSTRPITTGSTRSLSIDVERTTRSMGKRWWSLVKATQDSMKLAAWPHRSKQVIQSWDGIDRDSERVR